MQEVFHVIVNIIERLPINITKEGRIIKIVQKKMITQNNDGLYYEMCL